MKTQLMILVGLFLIIGCTLSAITKENFSSEIMRKEIMKRPIDCFLDDTPAPLSLASLAFYQMQVEKSQAKQQHKPMMTSLLVRIVPPQLPPLPMMLLWLLGLMIVILPGIFLRTLYNKNV